MRLVALLEQGGSLCSGVWLPPLPTYLLKKGANADGNPRLFPILFPMAPAQAVTFSRWALPGQCSSFSGPGQALLHLKLPPTMHLPLF